MNEQTAYALAAIAVVGIATAGALRIMQINTLVILAVEIICILSMFVAAWSLREEKKS